MKNNNKTQLISFPKEVKKQLLEEIKRLFLEQREEEIGDLSAELCLNFIIENIGPLIYNQAVNDAHAFMLEKVEDLYCLEKRFR